MLSKAFVLSFLWGWVEQSHFFMQGMVSKYSAKIQTFPKKKIR